MTVSKDMFTCDIKKHFHQSDLKWTMLNMKESGQEVVKNGQKRLIKTPGVKRNVSLSVDCGPPGARLDVTILWCFCIHSLYLQGQK